MSRLPCIGDKVEVYVRIQMPFEHGEEGSLCWWIASVVGIGLDGDDFIADIPGSDCSSRSLLLADEGVRWRWPEHDWSFLESRPAAPPPAGGSEPGGER